MIRHPKVDPDHFKPETWLTCIAVGCRERIDPWEHSFRCAEHRPTKLTTRHVTIVTADQVAAAIRDAAGADADYPWRLLYAILGEAPNLVARIMRELDR